MLLKEFCIILSEILFGPHGKIKKVKFYTDLTGHQKGDAMVTYATHEAAVLACNRVCLTPCFNLYIIMGFAFFGYYAAKWSRYRRWVQNYS